MEHFNTIDDFSLLKRRFHEKFATLRKKVHRVLDRDQNTKLDDESYDVFVNSILVDCRAIFIENSQYKKNCTIQNFYKATNHPELASSIDDLFNKKTNAGVSVREAIKGWVDKNIVHFDFIDQKTEQEHLDNVLSVIDRSTIDNLFVDILLVAHQYEEYRRYLEKLSFAVLEKLTGDVDSEE
jgi:hypothetical protein